MKKNRWLLPVMAACLLLPGCCDTGRPATVQVTGRITYGGKPLPKPGTICFAPVEAADGFPMRPARGNFDASGNYSAMTFEEGDGVIPGRYRVGIECWEVPPQPGGPTPKSYVPEQFQHPATSGIEYVVEVGSGDLVYNYDIPASEQQ